MIDFMVVSGPRCGTTWVANALTTDTTLCLHDPLAAWALEELDGITSEGKSIGISCTGILIYQDWLRAHPAKKVILHRKHEEICKSLLELGLPAIPAVEPLLWQVEGLHCQWEDIWHYDTFCKIYQYLLGKIPGRGRYEQLVQMHIQPRFEAVVVSPAAVQSYVQKIRENL